MNLSAARTDKGLLNEKTTAVLLWTLAVCLFTIFQMEEWRNSEQSVPYPFFQIYFTCVKMHQSANGGGKTTDKAYGTNEILDYIHRQDSEYTISPKTNAVNPWSCDWALYKERHLSPTYMKQIDGMEFGSIRQVIVRILSIK
ncbi:hypothetical protein OBV_40910 [Oscillibacter valericigenes Sjm18-20]|nr:hypothetical protein OBV_40910 [Oscillibacter valericigenes Sjm18-20]